MQHVHIHMLQNVQQIIMNQLIEHVVGYELDIIHLLQIILDMHVLIILVEHIIT